MAITPNLPVTQLAVTGTQSSHALDDGTRRIQLTNTHASAILYFRLTTGVTVGNGFPIMAGGSMSADVVARTGATLYLIGSGVLTAGLLEEG